MTPDRAPDAPSATDPDPARSADAVRRALGRSDRAPLRRVAVGVEGGHIVLRGTVPSYYLKQLAQATAGGVAGVAGLRNELRVAAGLPAPTDPPAPTDHP